MGCYQVISGPPTTPKGVEMRSFGGSDGRIWTLRSEIGPSYPEPSIWPFYFGPLLEVQDHTWYLAICLLNGSQRVDPLSMGHPPVAIRREVRVARYYPAAQL